MELMAIVQILAAVLFAGTVVAQQLGKLKLAKILKAVILSVETFGKEFPKVGDSIKKKIKETAEEAGAEKALNEEVKKLTDE